MSAAASCSPSRVVRPHNCSVDDVQCAVGGMLCLCGTLHINVSPLPLTVSFIVPSLYILYNAPMMCLCGTIYFIQRTYDVLVWHYILHTAHLCRARMALHTLSTYNGVMICLFGITYYIYHTIAPMRACVIYILHFHTNRL